MLNRADIQTESVNCLICNSNEAELLLNRGRDQEELSFKLCENCGLGYLSPRWTKESYNQYYAHEYDKYYRHDVFDLDHILKTKEDMPE